VVYAGRFRAGKNSWISRTEHGPLVHRASMIWSSSLLSFGNGIFLKNYLCLSIYYVRGRYARVFLGTVVNM
jgi:hypothetical protein